MNDNDIQNYHAGLITAAATAARNGFGEAALQIIEENEVHFKFGDQGDLFDIAEGLDPSTEVFKSLQSHLASLY